MGELQENVSTGASAAAALPQPEHQLLVSWASGQAQWVRQVVGTILQHRRDLTDKEVESAYDLLLEETSLKPAASTLSHAPVATVQTQATPDAELQLLMLSELAHINALAPGQTLEFHPKLTIVYGENGTGKTGFVRVFKALAGSRSVEDILDDISATVAGKPNAKVLFTYGGNTKTVEWQGEKGLAPLTAIQIFDSAGAVLHLNQDLTYIYTPGEVALYPLVQHAIEKVRQRLEAAIAARIASAPNVSVLQTQFQSGTAAAKAISTLDAKTNVAELVILATLTPSEEQERQTVQKEIEGLQAGSVTAEIKVGETAKSALEAALNAVRLIQIMDVGSYNGAVESLRVATENRDHAASSSLAGAAIPGVLKPVWKQFIEAGEQYIAAELNAGMYPKQGDACIYCQQPLATAAVELIQAYRSYCNDQHQSSVREAQAALDQSRSQLLAFDFNKLRVTAEEATSGSTFDHSVLAILKQADAFANAAKAGQQFQWVSAETDAKAAGAPIQKEVERLTTLITELRTADSAREESVRKRRARLAELDDRATLAKIMPNVNDCVGAAKWVATAERHSKGFAGILRALTLNAKTATEKLLNADFETRFHEECKSLAAPAVKLAFPARSGQVTRRKVLSEKHALKAILSEGEQKVIALADFLAEVGQRKPFGPVVFDDPVNSLDYSRMQQVAARITKLSQERQVIIFTHNIVFVAAMLAHLEAIKSQYTYYDIQKSNRPGVVTRGTHPRLDTVKNLTGKINALIQDAGKVGGQEQLGLVEQGYALIRNVCELIVEQELFGAATERFRPNVRITTLPNIKFDRLEAAVQAIVPVFEKACSYITAHSQPLETLNTRPTLDDLKNNWAIIQDARNAYNAK
jgi:energy-coupling factor transporter ATP-binding protein EcfA2